MSGTRERSNFSAVVAWIPTVSMSLGAALAVAGLIVQVREVLSLREQIELGVVAPGKLPVAGLAALACACLAILCGWAARRWYPRPVEKEFR